MPEPFAPDYASSPGTYLSIVLDNLGLTQTDLSARTGLSAKHVNQIIKGSANVSPEVASQLEFATDVPAAIWASLDARHQALRAQARTRDKLAGSLDWLDKFDLKELYQRRVIPTADRSVGTIEALLRYFGISDPGGWDRVWKPSITSFRRSPSFAPDATSTTVWLRAGQVAASRIQTAPFDQKALLGAIPSLRALTEPEPLLALPRLQLAMAALGVAVVFVSEFDGCRASGATWWASPTKAVVLLSNRGKREDRFWFSFFHEIGHVLHHAKRDTFLDQNRSDDERDDLPPWAEAHMASAFLDDGSRDSKPEREADDFAAEALIPSEYRSIVPALTSKAAVVELAARIGVSSGIVAGRYQFETGDYRKYNALRRTVPDELFSAL